MACERKKTLETHLQVDIFKNIYTGRSEIILTTGLDRNSTEDVIPAPRAASVQSLMKNGGAAPSSPPEAMHWGNSLLKRNLKSFFL